MIRRRRSSAVTTTLVFVVQILVTVLTISDTIDAVAEGQSIKLEPYNEVRGVEEDDNAVILEGE